MSNVDSVELILVVMVKIIVEVEYCFKRMDKCCSEMVSSADLQRMQVDLDCAHASDGLNLHGVRVVQDMHEVDHSWRPNERTMFN
nr:hypothetical protein [Tanacetum cinerariifolium]